MQGHSVSAIPYRLWSGPLRRPEWALLVCVALFGAFQLLVSFHKLYTLQANMMDRGDSREEISQISHGKWWAFGTVFQTQAVAQDGFVFIYTIPYGYRFLGGVGFLVVLQVVATTASACGSYRPVLRSGAPSLLYITGEGGMGRSHLGSVAFSLVEVDIVIPRFFDDGTNAVNLSLFRYRGQGSIGVLLGIATRLPQVLPRPPARSKISPPAASHRAGRGRRLADGSQRARDAGQWAASRGTLCP